MTNRRATERKGGFLRNHALSLAAMSILIVWIVLYSYFDPKTHWGSFFGNAIADWSGVVVTVIATKYFYEVGSTESKQPAHRFKGRLIEFIRDHSLTIFLLVTGLAWTALFIKMNSESKWGQVIGNIVSEWTQLLGLVLLTKKLIENKSKESQK